MAHSAITSLSHDLVVVIPSIMSGLNTWCPIPLVWQITMNPFATPHFYSFLAAPYHQYVGTSPPNPLGRDDGSPVLRDACWTSFKASKNPQDATTRTHPCLSTVLARWCGYGSHCSITIIGQQRCWGIKGQIGKLQARPQIGIGGVPLERTTKVQGLRACINELLERVTANSGQ